MKIRDLAYETASALDANRGRSLLTILGIVIGIAAVIAMTALIGGIKQSMLGELGLNQARLVNLYCYADRDITLDDLKKLEEKMPYYECLTTSTWASGKAKSATKTWDANIQGALPSYFYVMGMGAGQGSFYTQRDEGQRALVAVLDKGAVKQLFGDPEEQVVGESIVIDTMSYSIVAVTDSDDAMMGGGGTIYVPFSTAVARLGAWGSVNDIYGLATEDADMDTIADSTKRALITYFNLDADSEDVYVYTMKSAIDSLNTYMGSFQLMMTAVASISLLVGGIGIMNMMLTNVSERIREIGLRKALGAHRSDITMQFLLESVCLCVSGGIIGILVGYFGSFGLTGLAGSVMEGEFGSGPITPIIDMQSVLMATGICVLIGVLFGYYPARRAAKLDPVESLHYQ